MNKRVLLPCDFSGHSISLVQAVLSDQSDGPLDLVLCFGFRLDLSTSELLFVSRSQIIKSVVPKSFVEAIEVIRKEAGSRVDCIRIEPFYGTTQAAFKVFLEGNKISEIYIYKDFQSRIGHTSSFDITPMAIKMDIVHFVPFKGYSPGVECEDSFTEKCLSRVFG